MPRVGFEPTSQVIEQAKTVHALGRAATVIGVNFKYPYENIISTHRIPTIRWNKRLLACSWPTAQLKFAQHVKPRQYFVMEN
jgi:hypothetical protein